LIPGKQPIHFVSSSPEETIAIGRFIAPHLLPGHILAIEGDLGTGKTTLIKGLAAQCSNALVSSPTFTYLQIYEGIPPLFHFDLYRLKEPQEFLQMGFTDYFQQEGICCIEWPQRIESLFPPGVVRICLRHVEENKREIAVYELE
jgi:tRNA threonylcarbamoyladenosine biosynthesis protein TsaE